MNQCYLIYFFYFISDNLHNFTVHILSQLIVFVHIYDIAIETQEVERKDTIMHYSFFFHFSNLSQTRNIKDFVVFLQGLYVLIIATLFQNTSTVANIA